LGDPKKKHKKYKTPESPFDQTRLTDELGLIGTYGLRNKKELWRHRTVIRNFLRIAREMLSMDPEKRATEENDLRRRMHDLGLVQRDVGLEGVLGLRIEDVLERRLQTMVHRSGMASSLFQARQLITHGHITIGEREVKSPGHIVTRGEEKLIRYTPSSPYSAVNHPMRQELAALEARRQPA